MIKTLNEKLTKMLEKLSKEQRPLLPDRKSNKKAKIGITGKVNISILMHDNSVHKVKMPLKRNDTPESVAKNTFDTLKLNHEKWGGPKPIKIISSNGN